MEFCGWFGRCDFRIYYQWANIGFGFERFRSGSVRSALSSKRRRDRRLQFKSFEESLQSWIINRLEIDVSILCRRDSINHRHNAKNFLIGFNRYNVEIGLKQKIFLLKKDLTSIGARPWTGDSNIFGRPVAEEIRRVRSKRRDNFRWLWRKRRCPNGESEKGKGLLEREKGIAKKKRDHIPLFLFSVYWFFA